MVALCSPPSTAATPAPAARPLIRRPSNKVSPHLLLALLCRRFHGCNHAAKCALYDMCQGTLCNGAHVLTFHAGPLSAVGV